MSKLDELMVLADDYAADACGGTDPKEFSARRRAALQDALKAVVEDAERYRWLRNEAVRTTWEKPVVCEGARDLGDQHSFLSGDTLDAAIDAARKP